MDDLIANIQRAAVDIPEALIELIADGVQCHAQPTPRARLDVVRAVAPVSAREAALAIFDAWQATSPGVPGAAVALALRAAAKSVAAARSDQSIELVWTGPSSSVPMRSTRQALIDLTRAARRTLLLTSFSAYRDQGLIDEFSAAAVDRHVEVILILETSEDSRGSLSYDARYAFDELNGKATFYVWPAGKRPAGTSVLHVKAAVADYLVALISSANLTTAALERNMELGVLITGGALPRQLEQHFRWLVAQRILVPVTY